MSISFLQNYFIYPMHVVHIKRNLNFLVTDPFKVESGPGQPFLVSPADDQGSVDNGRVQRVKELLRGVNVGGEVLTNSAGKIRQGVQNIAVFYRLISFIESVEAKHKYKTIKICTHNENRLCTVSVLVFW